MFGYVTCEGPELKVKDYELYKGYYCGICRSVARRYGQLPRVVLTYDAVFVALLLGGLRDKPVEEDWQSRERCLIHPLEKRTVLREAAVDYAADVMLLLAYHKMEDDKADQGSLKAYAGEIMLRRAYKDIAQNRPELSQEIGAQMERQRQLEKDKTPSLDQAADPTGRMMEAILSSMEGCTPQEREILAYLGYRLGRWIYLLDALDDLEEDIDNHAYNPYLLRFQFQEGCESKEDFRRRVHDYCEKVLVLGLADMGEALSQIQLKRNQAMIENIVFMGLRRQTERVLQKADSAVKEVPTPQQ